MQVFQPHHAARPRDLGGELVLGVLPYVGQLAVEARQFHPGLLPVLAAVLGLGIILFPAERAREPLQLRELPGQRFLVFKPPSIADHG